MQLSDALALKARIKDGFCLGVPGEENPETRELYCLSGSLCSWWQDQMFGKQYCLVLRGASKSSAKDSAIQWYFHSYKENPDPCLYN